MNRQNGNKSAFEGVLFSLFGILFMLYWTYSAVKGGSVFVGLVFGGFGLFSMVRNLIVQGKALKNGGKNAPYQYKDGSNTADGSADPWDVIYPENRPEGDIGYSTEQYGGEFTIVSGGKNFCPYCGVMRQPDYEFCENCGKKLPD